jgi:hypothetical protein
MAYLGRYYADKMRGAAKLAAFRCSQEKSFADQAVAHLEDALQAWKAYTAIMSSQYKPQLMARTHFMNWETILGEVEKEVETVALEGDFPDVSFVGLADGDRLAADTELQVELQATDRHGIRETKLYLSGLLLKSHAEEPQVYSGESDELLKALRPGAYRLLAVAEDMSGTFGRRDVQILVGDVAEDRAKNATDKIQQVVLAEGERLTEGEVREYPRLECDLRINDDGRLVLYGIIPGRDRERQLLWKASMYKSHGSHFATLENGQLVIYRGTPDEPGAAPFRTPSVSGPGPFKLGITASKQLVVFRDSDAGKDVVWRGR